MLIQGFTSCGGCRRASLAASLSVFLFFGLITLNAPAKPTPPPAADAFTGRPRVVIISDIGNEPDDQMSFVRLLLYSNQMDLEAMIATTSTWQKTATHPETMHSIVEAYRQVRPNLLLHAQGWPTADELDARIFAGQSAYGMAATGAGKSSAGSQALAKAIERDDPRPLWICLWGGVNTLAQALIDLRAAHTPAEMDRLAERLRVSSISDQDDAGPWIRREFPTISYVVKPSPPNGEEYYSATWTGISGDLYYRNGAGADTSLVTNDWLETHIRVKGPMGKWYPRFMFIMEGDTPSYLGLIDNGLNAYRRPDWGGWGGRYVFRQPYGETHDLWTQGGDECKIIELADGRLLFDMRQETGPTRWFADSSDGGATWTHLRPGITVTPVACAIKRLTVGGRSWVLWTGPEGMSRKRLVIRTSGDEGLAFPHERLLTDGFAA